MSTLVSDYDTSEMSTVSNFFTSRVPQAYVAIKELGIQSELSYRALNKKGKGSRLYFIRDLQRVQKYLDEQESERQDTCPDDCMDMQMVELKYGLKQHIISNLFIAMGLLPSGVYKRNKRPVNYYRKSDVAYVMRVVAETQTHFGPNPAVNLIDMRKVAEHEPEFADLMTDLFSEKYK